MKTKNPMPTKFERRGKDYIGYAIALKLRSGREMIILAPTIDEAEAAGESMMGAFDIDRNLIHRAAIVSEHAVENPLAIAPVAAPAPSELPALPAPTVHEDGVWHIEYFTATQMRAYAAAALAQQAAQEKLWKPLNDVQWMNIVNHDHAYESMSKEDAVHHAVKMTEAKLKEINGGAA